MSDEAEYAPDGILQLAGIPINQDYAMGPFVNAPSPFAAIPETGIMQAGPQVAPYAPTQVEPEKLWGGINPPEYKDSEEYQIFQRENPNATSSELEEAMHRYEIENREPPRIAAWGGPNVNVYPEDIPMYQRVGELATRPPGSIQHVWNEPISIDGLEYNAETRDEDLAEIMSKFEGISPSEAQDRLFEFLSVPGPYPDPNMVGQGAAIVGRNIAETAKINAELSKWTAEFNRLRYKLNPNLMPVTDFKIERLVPNDVFWAGPPDQDSRDSWVDYSNIMPDDEMPEWGTWRDWDSKLYYAEGGQVSGVMDEQYGEVGDRATADGFSSEEMSMIVELVSEALRNPNTEESQRIIQMFIAQFGEGELKALIAKLSGDTETEAGGRVVTGPGDWRSDSVPAMVDGNTPASLSTGEYVIPSDVVNGIGGGDTEAGIQGLDELLRTVRGSGQGDAQAGLRGLMR